MSIPDKIEEILKAIKALESFMQEIKSDRMSKPESDLNAVAAKIIKEIKYDNAECKCNKEILEALRSHPGSTSVPSREPELEPRVSDYVPKYTYPNFNVGNKELGSSENPRALKWSFDKESNPSLK